MFYDITHPVRRELHRQYIRQCLNNFADNPKVIQLTSAEFTGPLHFVQLWLDVIAEWETETGKKAKVALSTTKDVQDAILADPKRAAVVEDVYKRQALKHFLCSIRRSFAEEMCRTCPYPAKKYKRHQQSDR